MANKKLLYLTLLRHAKSDWHSGARDDFSRPLNARGRRDAPAMGKWLMENGYAPDCVVSSPAARAVETAQLVCAAMNFDLGKIMCHPDLYDAPDWKIETVAAVHMMEYSRVMLVGHNPGLEFVLRDYCPDAPAFDDGKLMPTCAAAVVEFDTVNNSRLLELMRPALL